MSGALGDPLWPHRRMRHPITCRACQGTGQVQDLRRPRMRVAVIAAVPGAPPEHWVAWLWVSGHRTCIRGEGASAAEAVRQLRRDWHRAGRWYHVHGHGKWDTWIYAGWREWRPGALNRESGRPGLAVQVAAELEKKT